MHKPRVTGISCTGLPAAVPRAAALAAALVLAGCASGPGRDGPPRSPPTGLQTVPSAEPRIEALRSGGPNKPYVVLGRSYTPLASDSPLRESGLASWYGKAFHGRSTASGEPYDMYAMTAAHTTMPIPSYARVRNPANGREIIVRVNDRGPFHDGRVIDLSYTAALQLDLLRGVAPVEVERITPADIRAGNWRRGSEGTAFASVATAASAVPAAQPAAARAPAPAYPPQIVASRVPTRAASDGMVMVPLSAVQAVGTAAAVAVPSKAPATGGWTVPLTVRGARPAAVPARAAPAGDGWSTLPSMAPPAAAPVPVPVLATVPVTVVPAPSPAAPDLPTFAVDTMPALAADDRASRAQPQALPPMAPLPLPAGPASAAAVQGPAAAPANSAASAASPSPSPSPSPSLGAAVPSSAGAGSATVASPSTGSFWLQLGAFGRPEGAEQLQRQASAAVAPLAPQLSVFSEGGLHRLQAGPFASREDARAAAEKLRADLSLAPVVVERR